MQMKQQVKEQFNHFLSTKHLKTTLQRNLVVDAMVEVGRHTHVDELFLLLRAKHPYIGHATVYRALRLLAESGLAREINLGDGITRYQLVRKGERHDYLVCSCCGGITEFENSTVEKEQLKLALSLGFAVETLKIELKGLCRNCQGRNSSTH